MGQGPAFRARETPALSLVATLGTMNLAQLSVPQRVAAGLGCVVILALGVGAVLFLTFDIISRRKISAELAGAPAAWTDSIRVTGRAPDLSGLTLPRNEDGDGARIVHDITANWQRRNVEEPYRALLSGEGTRADSATWREIAADTGLDRFVAAARKKEWKALDGVLAEADSGVYQNILRLPIPMYAPARNAARGLVIRGLERLRRGDRVGARVDLGAATALGEQIFRREPSLVGSFMGRSVIASGARGWVRYGELVRDTVLAARARIVLAWAGAPPTQIAQLLIVAPDSALVLARDSTLALGVRGEALVNTMSAWMLRPRGFLFGPPRRYKDAIRALAQDPDRDFARLAEITAATADRMNVVGLSGLLREAQR